jgi:hypothetical protein
MMNLFLYLIIFILLIQHLDKNMGVNKDLDRKNGMIVLLFIIIFFGENSQR